MLVKNAMIDRVIFVRPKYQDGQREILAVFPDLKERDGHLTCYAHIGQHSTCHPSFKNRTRATPEQYAPLLKELRGRGYNLAVVNESGEYYGATNREQDYKRATP